MPSSSETLSTVSQSPCLKPIKYSNVNNLMTKGRKHCIFRKEWFNIYATLCLLELNEIVNILTLNKLNF